MSGLAAPRRDSGDETRRTGAERLRALVAQSAGAGIPRRALLMRLSQLPAELARPHHLRLARAALDPLTVADRARRFDLPNGDLAIVWRGEAVAALGASLDAVQHLFADQADRLPDPLAFVVSFHLPEEAGALLRAVEESLLPPGDRAGAGSPGPAAPAPLDLPALAALEAALARADVARFGRRDPVCELLPQGGFRLRWEKRALSVAEIAVSLLPGRAVRADPWLFRRLTRTLDRRMLALLAAPQELRGAGPLGLNLSVSSILSPEFLRFDANLPAALRGQVVIDLLPADIMTDPATFLFARDFARDRGYRLLLRGITTELLDLFPLRRTGLDLLRLRWSPELVRRGPELMLPDAGNIVLSRADTAEALAWGREQGILLYQGRATLRAFSGKTIIT